MMKKFSELGVTVQDERKMFNCSQVSISDVLNCEIIVEDFIPDVKTSHGEGRYLVKFKHSNGADGHKRSFFKENFGSDPQRRFPFQHYD